MGINYVICAAGAGSRTGPINPVIPKPLLRINGKTLFEHSLASLDLATDDTLIVVTQKSHRLRDALEARIVELNLPSKVLFKELDSLTRGQLETAYFARELYDLNKGVCIFNSDTFFRSPNLNAKTKDPSIDGVIPCSIEEGDMWSFCEAPADCDGASITRVTEKQRISKWCSVGFYYFRNTNAFLMLAEHVLLKSQPGEFYVAPIYNELIVSGAKIALDVVSTFRPMGSVDQIERYWGLGLREMREQNS